MASEKYIILQLAAMIMVVSGQGLLPGIPNFCLDPPVTGICRANIPAFYFNPETRACDCFIYGGCLGNDNAFPTLAQCMVGCGVNPRKQENTRACDEILGSANPLADEDILEAIQGSLDQPHLPDQPEPQTQQTDQLAPESLQSDHPASEIQQTLQPVSEIQQPLQPVSEIQQALEPVSEIQQALEPVPEIQQTLEPVSEIQQTLQFPQQTAHIPNFCYEPPVKGLCRANIPSFYYNTETNACDCFVYGGCGGNDNRFPTLSQCLAGCAVRPSLQHNTARCDEILGTDNPLSKPEVLDAIRMMPDPTPRTQDQPIQEPQQPIQEPQQPIQEPQQPIQESQQPIQESQQPTQESQQPQQPTQETEEPQQPTQQTLHPQQPAQQTLHPQQPAQQTLHPQQPAQQTLHPQQPAQQTEHPSQQTGPRTVASQIIDPTGYHIGSMYVGQPVSITDLLPVNQA